MKAALRATWDEVAERAELGEARWGGEGGEEGFWRAFVAAAFRRSGGGGDGLPEGLLEGLIAHFADERHWAVFPEVRETLGGLKERGLKLAVVSNWDSTLPSLLARLGLAPYFDAIVVSALVGAAKPAARIFEEALAATGVAPHEALHVGDNLLEDYHGARRAGLSALLVVRDGGPADGAETVDSLSPLLERLGKEPA